MDSSDLRNVNMKQLTCIALKTQLVFLIKAGIVYIDWSVTRAQNMDLLVSLKRFVFLHISTYIYKHHIYMN